MVVYRTMADPAYVDAGIDPSERDYGSLLSERPDLMNLAALGFARTVTPRAWLSTWSGLSSNADLVANVARIAEPTLIVSAARDREIRPGDSASIFEACASKDKCLATIAGARHAGAEDPHDDLNRLGSHLGAMAQSRPGGGVMPAGDVKTAEHLGRRVAEAALRWGTTASRSASGRHPSARSWAFPPPQRPELPHGAERTNLRELAARPDGGWMVVLEADARGAHVACDLIRIPEGATLDGTGIVRALVLTSDAAPPDPVPPVWRGALPAPFPPFEEGERGALPLAIHDGALRMLIEEASPSLVRITIGDRAAEVPRYWLARLLHRVALHGVKLGYAETYGGFFSDDRSGALRLGLRSSGPAGEVSVTIPGGEALAMLERIYRAVAPPGYTERL